MEQTWRSTPPICNIETDADKAATPTVRDNGHRMAREEVVDPIANAGRRAPPSCAHSCEAKNAAASEEPIGQFGTASTVVHGGRQGPTGTPQGHESAATRWESSGEGTCTIGPRDFPRARRSPPPRLKTPRTTCNDYTRNGRSVTWSRNTRLHRPAHPDGRRAPHPSPPRRRGKAARYRHHRSKPSTR